MLTFCILLCHCVLPQARDKQRVLSRNVGKDDLPYFEKEDIIGGAKVWVFKEVKLLTVMINVEEVLELLDIEVVDDKVVHCDFQPGIKKSKYFNKWMDGHFPSHFCPTHRNSTCHRLPKEEGESRRGRSPPVLGGTTLIVHYHGLCGYHVDGCGTTFNAGFGLDSLLTSKLQSAPKVPFLFQMNGHCTHLANSWQGRLSCQSRDRARNEVCKI